MRSPERSRRIVTVALVGLVLVFASVLAWELNARSAIPLELRGEVRSITVKSEHPGIRNAWFVRVDDRTRHLDQAIAEQLRVGDQVEKDAWERVLTVNGTAVPLGLSQEARAALWFAPLMTLAAGALCCAAWRSRQAPSAARPRAQPAKGLRTRTPEID